MPLFLQNTRLSIPPRQGSSGSAEIEQVWNLLSFASGVVDGARPLCGCRLMDFADLAVTTRIFVKRLTYKAHTSYTLSYTYYSSAYKWYIIGSGELKKIP